MQFVVTSKNYICTRFGHTRHALEGVFLLQKSNEKENDSPAGAWKPL